MLAFHCAGIHYLLHILTTTWLNFCAFRICLLWWGVRRLSLSAIVLLFYPHINLGLLVLHAWALSPACLDIFYIVVIVLQESGSIFLLQISVLPCLALIHPRHRLDGAVLSLMDPFFVWHASSQGLHVCVALRIGIFCGAKVAMVFVLFLRCFSIHRLEDSIGC